jgi:hypothetical protein
MGRVFSSGRIAKILSGTLVNGAKAANIKSASISTFLGKPFTDEIVERLGSSRKPVLKIAGR